MDSVCRARSRRRTITATVVKIALVLWFVVEIQVASRCTRIPGQRMSSAPVEIPDPEHLVTDRLLLVEV